MSENFDMQALANLIGQNAMTVKSISEGFAALTANVEEQSKRQTALRKEHDKMRVDVENTKADVETLRQEFADVKENTAITRRQVMDLKDAMYARIKSQDISREFPRELEKECVQVCFHWFYRDLKHFYDIDGEPLMSSAIADTPKKNYDTLIKIVKSWWPSGGIESVITEAEKRFAEKTARRNQMRI